MSPVAAVAEMAGYFGTLVERHRHEPGEDMISTLVHERLEDGSAPSFASILGIGFTMVTGGNDTTTGLLGGALELLTRVPFTPGDGGACRLKRSSSVGPRAMELDSSRVDRGCLPRGR